MTPAIYGRPATSLRASADTEGAWSNRREAIDAGARGEVEVAALIERACDQQAVFHDLRIPGMRANIDHAVLGSRALLLLDAKFWRPGFYWTACGVTRRGLERVAHADKRTLPAAADRLGRYLQEHGVHGIDLLLPIMAIVPSRPVPAVTLMCYRPAGARAIRADRLGRRHMPPGAPGRSGVQVLVPLLNRQQAM